MEIPIGVNNDRVFYPDIAGNLELPEDQRFAFVLKRISRYKMTSHAIRTSIVDGAAVQVIDTDTLIRLCVTDIRNPPNLRDENDNVSVMTLEDVFTRPELESVAAQLDSEVGKLVRRSRENETKNS